MTPSTTPTSTTPTSSTTDSTVHTQPPGRLLQGDNAYFIVRPDQSAMSLYNGVSIYLERCWSVLETLAHNITVNDMLNPNEEGFVSHVDFVGTTLYTAAHQLSLASSLHSALWESMKEECRRA